MTALKRHASGVWRKTLKDGEGAMTTASGALQETPFSCESRFGNEGDTNPEELISAALAGCYSMTLANFLTENSYRPNEIRTRATAAYEDGAIRAMHLDVEGDVQDIDQESFRDLANAAEKRCPIAGLLGSNVDLTLEASLRH